MPEMLDIVNDNDEVIGTEEKDAMHEKGLLHRCIQVLIVQNDGKLVVQQRHHTKKREALLFDCSVGGHVDSGESYEQAAVREMQEEMGVEGTPEYLTDFRVKSDVENMLGRSFILHHNGPYTNWEREAERLEFMTPQEAAYLSTRYPYLFTPAFLETLKVYLAQEKISTPQI